MTGKAQVARVLERRLARQFARVPLVGDIPGRAVIIGRIEERSLQRSDSSIDNPFTLAGNAGQRVLGSTAESPTRIGGERTS
jgi:hypothetical protein